MRWTWLASLFVFLATLGVLYACGASAPVVDEKRSSEVDPFVLRQPTTGVLESAVRSAPYLVRHTLDRTTIVHGSDGATLALRHVTRLAGSTLGAGELALDPGRRRALVHHAAVSEWYEATPRGVEHGFTLARRPERAERRGDRRVVTLEIALDAPELEVILCCGRDDELEIVSRGARAPLFRYGSLDIRDRDGHRIEGKLGAGDDGRTVRILFDDTAAAYPVVVDPLLWALSSKLVRLTPAANDTLSYSVAVTGSDIVLGATGANLQRGEGVLFHRDELGWQERGRLEVDASTPDDPTTLFGLWSAMDDETLLLGSVNAAARFARAPGSPDSGATAWRFEALLEPNWRMSRFDSGPPLALQGPTAAVFVARKASVVDAAAEPADAAPPDAEAPSAAVFVWSRIEGTWSRQPTQRLVLPVPVRSDSLGAVRIDGDTLAVGTGNEALVYRRQAAVGSAEEWALEATLQSPDLAPPGTGWSALALSGDDLMMGGLGAPPAVYAFHRAGTIWSLTGKIQPQNLGLSIFGLQIALKGESAFISDPNRAGGAGAIFRFRRLGATWALEEELAPLDLTVSSQLGFAMAMTSDTLVVSAAGQGAGRGAAYVYELRKALGDPCSASPSCASGFCVDGVCCDSSCGGGEVDCLACNVPATRGTCSRAGAAQSCRPARGECDLPETCDGVSTQCPADVVRENGATCGRGTCRQGACVTESVAATADASDQAVPPVPLPAAGSGCSATHKVVGEVPSVAIALVLAGIVRVRRRRGVARWRRSASILGGLLALAAAPRAEAANDRVWSQRQLLEDPGQAALSRFGNTVTLATSGNEAVVSRVGSALVLRRTGSGWSIDAELAPFEQLESYANFGRAAAMEGDLAIVSANRHNQLVGAAFTFERVAGLWRPAQKLVPPQASAFMQFGTSLSLRGSTLAIGAPRDGGADATGNEPGAVYIFERDRSGAFALATKLGSATGHYFGYDVALSDDTLLVDASSGAEFSSNLTTFVPTVHFFQRTGSSWEEVSVIEGASASFGQSLSVEGDLAAIGVPFTAQNDTGGFVDLYRRDPTSRRWSAFQRLEASDRTPGATFGERVKIHGGRIVVGASAGPDGKGAVYVFERDPKTSAWVETKKLRASDGQLDDRFGWDLDFKDDALLVGAYGRRLATGGVYAFYLGLGAGTACANADACASQHCVDGVCCDSACGDGNPDDCMACSVSAGAERSGVCGATTPHVCRAARGPCDVADVCDGVSTICPADLAAENGVACGQGQTCSSGRCVDAVLRSQAPGAAEGAAEPALPELEGSCACRATRHRPWPRGGVLALLAPCVAAIARRRRGASRRLSRRRA